MTHEDVNRIVEALRAKLLEEFGEEKETKTPAQAARGRLHEMPAYVRIDSEWNWEWMFHEGVRQFRKRLDHEIGYIKIPKGITCPLCDAIIGNLHDIEKELLA